MVKATRLPNGNLLIPARAESDDGTVIGDGMIEIGPEHPDFAAWSAGAVEREPVPEGGYRVSEYEEWVGRVLSRGLDPCLVVQDEQGREIDKWGNVVGPSARR